MGIGAMNASRIEDFFNQMVKAGLYQAKDVDLSKVATTQFVNKQLGIDLKKALAPK
jgi:NitT/TauT family transport system substrate-binding protein